MLPVAPVPVLIVAPAPVLIAPAPVRIAAAPVLTADPCSWVAGR